MNEELGEKTIIEKDVHLLSELLDLCPASITIHDVRGNFLYANKKTYELHGYSKEEFFRLKLHELDSPESSRLIAPRIQELLRTGESSFKVEHYRKDRSLLPLQVYVKIIDWQGQKAILSVALDNTETMASIRKVQDRDIVITHILEQTLSGYWDWDIPSGNEFLSPTLKMMFGYEDSELPNRAETWQKLIFSEDLKNVLEVFKRHVESHGESPFYNEVRYRHKNGSTIWVICTGRVIEWDKDNRPIRMIGCHIDITSRKRMENEIEQRELKLKHIVENAFEGITIVDVNGRVIYESPGIKRILGYSTDERLGDTTFDNIHPEDLAKAQELFRRIYEHPEEVFRLVLRIKNKGDQWRWIECNGKNLLHEKSIQGILINYRDITEKKEAEEDRVRLEQQMQQNEKLEAIGTLAAGIAHDFNNLLGGIYGYMDMARMLSNNPKATEYLNASLNTMNRARGLTQQLLTFAKGGAPTLKIGNLGSFVRETAQFASSGSNVICTFDIPDELWACEYDATQIGQVVENLVINAHQAMPMGGILTITAINIHVGPKEHALLPYGRYVKISVSDTGVGIAKKIVGRIFEPFFTTKQKGSGLGLATSYSIVRRHNGLIDVESEPGRGSTFYFYLPASDESVLESVTLSADFAKYKGRILIMDDEKVVRDSLSAMLMHHGFTTVVSKDGAEAIRLIDESIIKGDRFSAIILDLTIPGGMGGKETIIEIRKKDREIPAFVSSGYAADPIVSNPWDYGFTDSIRKPFTTTDLIGMLVKYIK